MEANRFWKEIFYPRGERAEMDNAFIAGSQYCRNATHKITHIKMKDKKFINKLLHKIYAHANARLLHIFAKRIYRVILCISCALF